MGNIELKYKSSSDASLLYELLGECPSSKKIVLNLEDVKFLKPNEIILIVMFLIYLVQDGNSISITLPKNKQTRDYLQGIDLVKFCNKNMTQSSTLNGIASQTAMPIRRLTEEKMGEYIDSAKSYFQGICPSKDLTMLNMCMAEMLNNVYNHSKSKIDAYAFCQYFPSRNEIEVVIGDYGIGIPNSVNTYLDEDEHNTNDSLSDIEALEWAIVLNNSVKSIPNNQGKGLDNILNFVKSNGGKVFIYTNDAFLRANSVDKFDLHIEQNYIENFKGTIVAFTIKVGSLDDLDEELIDFDF